MSAFKNKNNLRTIEAQIVQSLKNNEVRPKFTDSYKRKSVLVILLYVTSISVIRIEFLTGVLWFAAYCMRSCSC